ncbi:MAG: hypothetical protein HY912_11475 [Desulfomonile tiedjei]|uniref:Uncharacterized protein n=1 Tax=Desulfomonile tiedjei TaxID=2358 RepID=A0A9D6V1E2_9BACT|nr:hypothetical protein [Desulfomonile tiedjei]
MRRVFPCCLILVCIFVIGSNPCHSEDLVVKPCSELIRMAENYQEDLKTVDTVLGSAIEAGSIDRIKNYKLRKGSIRQRLDSVMQAIDARGCVKSSLQKCAP